MSERFTAKLLREKEVHGQFGFSRPWLKKRRQLNLPPAFVRIGRAVYYERSALEQFIARCRVTPGDQAAK